MSRLRIVCLSADASSNSLVRLYPIAKVLARRHDVVVAGFRSGDAIFDPYRDEFEYRTIRARTLPAFGRQAAGLARRLQADLVYAFKPLSTSLWPGLALRRSLDVPLVVDIEDWELGWYLDRAPLDILKHLAHAERANGLLWTAFNERLVPYADRVTVVSRFLQGRFGGALLPHGADTTEFDPSRWSRDEALEQLALPDAEYVVFTGTPMRSKGVEEVLLAIEQLDRPQTRMLIVGSFQHDPDFAEVLRRRFGDRLVLMGARPHHEMPMFLRIASVVALAQRPGRETTAQVPGKVYEAMAMGCPILATAVSDLPEILSGCGAVVTPANQPALVAKLAELLADGDGAMRLGVAARRRCIECYSWDAMECILDGEVVALTR